MAAPSPFHQVTITMPLAPLIIDVAIPVSLDDTFHYLVPPELQHRVAVGCRVLVPFGRRKMTGYVAGFVGSSGYDNLKTVLALLDEEPVLTPEEIEFYRWIAGYYHHPFGLVLKGALPPGINVTGSLEENGQAGVLRGGKAVRTEMFFSSLPGDGKAPRGKGADILAHLKAEGKQPLAALRSRYGDCYPQLRRLRELGLVEVETREVYRSPFGDEPVEADSPPPLSRDQAHAVQSLKESMAAGRFSPFLLYGITGSGKTEVYLRTIAEVLSQGRTALVLVPEIALTPQLIRRFRQRFGDGMAVLHSGLSEGERFDEWRRIRRGEAPIVVGARSAVFAPLKNLGIIVVDEEHDSSYKQSEGLRYNGRDLALVRGKQANALVLLGSATPLVTSWHAVEEGRLACLRLPERVAGAELPAITVADMRNYRKSLLAEPLVTGLAQALARGGQALLFLNRRGFATFLVCRECGETVRCPNCAVTLTHHRGRGRHICHYCDYSIAAPSLCPACKGGEIGLFGAGTERLEDELARLFPEARIGRMDRDTVKGRGGHARILRQLEEGRIDILVGTQMITKGHDVPGVSYVGVVSADACLNLPDHLSAERTFQLLTQVAGRAGRGGQRGDVLVQTLAPDHYAVRAALAHDYEGFFREEIQHREDAFYPPFARLAFVLVSAVSAQVSERSAEDAAKALRDVARQSGGRVLVLGPAPAPLARLRGRSRWQILLKAGQRQDLHRLLATFRRHYTAPSGVRLAIDVDPVDML